MFSWLSRLFRRTKSVPAAAAPGVEHLEGAGNAPPEAAIVPVEEQPAVDAPAGPEETDGTIREMDYALLITDSGSLEDLPEAARYVELARQHGGMIQPTVSGLTLILFEPGDGEEDSAGSGRVAFADALEKKSLARIRCLHGQTRVVRASSRAEDGNATFTLLNFHVLVQHAAALNLGEVTEAGSYHVARRTRSREKTTTRQSA